MNCPRCGSPGKYCATVGGGADPKPYVLDGKLHIHGFETLYYECPTCDPSDDGDGCMFNTGRVPVACCTCGFTWSRPESGAR